MRGISNIWTELSIPPSPLPIGTSSRKEKAGSRSKAAVAELPSTGSRLQILLSSPELPPPNPSIASRKQIFRRRRGPTTAVVNSCRLRNEKEIIRPRNGDMEGSVQSYFPAMTNIANSAAATTTSTVLTGERHPLTEVRVDLSSSC